MYDAANTVVLQLQLEANKVNVDVSQIVITARSDLDDPTDFSAVRLYEDVDLSGTVSAGDTPLGGDQVFVIDDGGATFAFAAATIMQGTSRFYLVEVDLAGTADHGESFRLGVAARNDIQAIESVSLDPVSPSGPPVWSSTFTIQGVAQLEVAEGANSPAGGGVYDGTPSVVMLQLRVTAGSAEDINLSSVTFTASGTMNDATDVTGVSLYLDSNDNGSLGALEPQIDITRTFSGDDGTVTFDLTGRTLDAGDTEHWLVVYDLTSPLTTNDTFQVRLVAAGDISGTGAVTFVAANIVGTPVDGPVMHVQGVGSITGVTSASPPAAADVPFVGEWPILRLTISTGPNEPVDVTEITVNHGAGTANPVADVSEVRLYHDVNANGRYDCWADTFLASGTYSGNSVTLSSFTLVCTAAADTQALVQYVMAGDEAGAPGRTHQVTLDPTTDITARGHDTLQPISITGLPVVTGPTMTVMRDTWDTVAASGLAGRYDHTAVTDGTRAYIWGGRSGAATYFNDGAIYDPLSDSWSSITTTGAPGNRSHHVSVWAGDKLFVWGGYDGSTYLGDGALYDPSDNSWTPVSSANAPASRMDAVAVWTGSRVVVWGGYAVGYLKSGGVYDPASDTWTATSEGSGCPDGRRSTAADWSGTYMLVWGGYDLTYLNDGGRFNPSGNSWSSIPASGAPTQRRLHTAVWCEDRFVVWGGYDGTTYLDTGAYYQGASWHDIDLGAPAGRSEHAAVWDGRYMTVWGGQTGDGASDVTQSGSRFDPSDDSWATTQTTGAPSARRLHIGVWTGGGMIIWGGGTSTAVIPPATATGGRYLP
jgi:N-acetylneuraminic acid mutarotase